MNLVLAILRARQMWGGQAQALPGLREALGYAERSDDREAADAAEARARALVEAMEQAGWEPARSPGRSRPPSAPARDRAVARPVAEVLTFAATEVVPRLPRPPTRSPGRCTRSTAGSSRPGRAARRCAAW